MARSTTYTLTSSRNDIIEGAFDLLGLIKDEGGVARTSDYNRAGSALNKMIAEWAAEDIGIWAQQDCKLYLQKADADYVLGPSGDHATLQGYETAVAADAASGASSITVDSIANMVDGDYIGIKLDGGAFQWTTINGTPAGVTVNLDDVLTDDVSEDAVVAFYTSKVQRILDYRSPRYRNSSGTDRPLWKMSRSDYLNIPNKTQSDAPVGTYLDIQLDGPILRVWPVPRGVGEQIMLDVQVPLQFMTDPAHELPDNAVSTQRLSRLIQQAEIKKRRLKTWDNEQTYFQAIPGGEGDFPGSDGW
jgi:hypothetical protein